MSHLEEQIEDEKEATKEYYKLAKKNPKESKVLNRISKDEKEHEKELTSLELKEKKKKLAKKMKHG